MALFISNMQDDYFITRGNPPVYKEELVYDEECEETFDVFD